VQARRGDGEAHQWRAQAQVAVTWQHCEPVALPPPRHRGQWVKPDGPADDPAGEADHVYRRRVVIVGVRVPAAAEQALLDHEYLVTDPEVSSPLALRGHGTAGRPEPARPARRRASGC
jgi:hypothetical protein